MARIVDDLAVYDDVYTGGYVYDADWDEMVRERDYILNGSEPLSPWEAMLYASAGAQTFLYSQQLDTFA